MLCLVHAFRLTFVRILVLRVGCADFAVIRRAHSPGSIFMHRQFLSHCQNLQWPTFQNHAILRRRRIFQVVDFGLRC
jgi:hypothetical protein